MKHSWDNVCGFCSISCGSFLYICWLAEYHLEKAVVSGVPLCHAMERWGLGIHLLFIFLSKLIFFLSCPSFFFDGQIYLQWYTILKLENILNVSTKQSFIFPGSPWLMYLYEHSCVYLLLVHCIKTHQILRAWSADTFCASYMSKGTLLCSYKKG